MRHGYTNTTERTGGHVRKTYAGPEAGERARAEHLALTCLRGSLPVPAVVEQSPDGTLVTQFVEGVHGQDQIEAGHAPEVLAACGDVLRSLHDLDPQVLGFGDSPGVISHGDFGPNNVLFDPTTFEVTAVVDWEFAHVGTAVTDIAWCEWIVRMHHPAAVEHLSAFFVAYGTRPSWQARHQAMEARCRWLEDFCRRWGATEAEELWRDRTRITHAWAE